MNNITDIIRADGIPLRLVNGTYSLDGYGDNTDGNTFRIDGGNTVIDFNGTKKYEYNASIFGTDDKNTIDIREIVTSWAESDRFAVYARGGDDHILFSSAAHLVDQRLRGGDGNDVFVEDRSKPKFTSALLEQFGTSTPVSYVAGGAGNDTYIANINSSQVYILALNGETRVGNTYVADDVETIVFKDKTVKYEDLKNIR